MFISPRHAIVNLDEMIEDWQGSSRWILASRFGEDGWTPEFLKMAKPFFFSQYEKDKYSYTPTLNVELVTVGQKGPWIDYIMHSKYGRWRNPVPRTQFYYLPERDMLLGINNDEWPRVPQQNWNGFLNHLAKQTDQYEKQIRFHYLK